MSNPLFPSSSDFNSVTAVNPTLMSVGRSISGAEASVLLGTTSGGLLTSVNTQGLTSYGIQPLDATLTAIAGISTTPGILVQTGTDTFEKRTLTGTDNQVNIQNGAGTTGNPTFSLPQNIHTTANPQFNNLTIDGFFYLGGTSSTSKFTLNYTATDTTIGGGQISVTPTHNTATARTHYGLLSSVNSTYNETSATNQYGGWFALSNSNVGVGKTISGTITALYVDGRVISPNHRGTFGNTHGIYIWHGATSAATGSGTQTNTYGIKLSSDFAGAAGTVITNSYGIQLGGNSSTTYPTNLWGIYEQYTAASNAANYFASPVLIGAATRGANFAVARNNSGAAWSTAGISFRVNSNTHTDTSTGIGATVASNSINTFAGGILAATNTNVTYTNAYNLYLAGAPTAGSNVTLTNSWALWINTGQSRFGGDVFVGTTSTFDATVKGTNLRSGTNATGIQIRGGTSLEPTFEFWRATTAIPDGGVIGKIGYWGGYGSATEIARINALAVGTAENAADIVISTATAGTLAERLRVQSTGRTVIQQLNIPTGTPAFSTSAGTAGDILWDANYIYICTSTNVWERTGISTW